MSAEQFKIKPNNESQLFFLIINLSRSLCGLLIQTHMFYMYDTSLFYYFIVSKLALLSIRQHSLGKKNHVHNNSQVKMPNRAGYFHEKNTL